MSSGTFAVGRSNLDYLLAIGLNDLFSRGEVVHVIANDNALLTGGSRLFEAYFHPAISRAIINMQHFENFTRAYLEQKTGLNAANHFHVAYLHTHSDPMIAYLSIYLDKIAAERVEDEIHNIVGEIIGRYLTP